MREILFRAKSQYENKWVYGVPIPQERNTRKTDEYDMADAVNYDEFDGYEPSYYFEPIKKETIGQYTGEDDKNGRKIFEGDIVQVNDKYVDSVVFSNGCFCMDRQIMMFEFTYQYFDKIEVIGNIHDNPELLKEGK